MKFVDRSNEKNRLLQALQLNSKEAIKEYAVWGGVPRYWELHTDLQADGGERFSPDNIFG